MALVTGSARGIGRAIAERYASLGARVVINYLSNEARARDTVTAIERAGGKAIAVQADVAKPADLDRLFTAALGRFHRLDIVVANAGVEVIGRRMLDVTEAEFDRIYSANTKGAFFTLQFAAKHVADGGRIIYVGSSTTAFPLPGYALYGGSKIAGQFLVEVLAKEIGIRGVTVNSILPTAIEGAGVFTEGSNEEVMQFVRSFRPIQRMGTLDDVANTAEYLASDLVGFISGQAASARQRRRTGLKRLVVWNADSKHGEMRCKNDRRRAATSKSELVYSACSGYSSHCPCCFRAGRRLA